MSDYKVKHNEHEVEEHHDIGEDLGMRSIWGNSIAFFFFCIAISAWLVGIYGKVDRQELDVKVFSPNTASVVSVKEQQQALLNEYRVVDADANRVSISIEDAKSMAMRELINQQRNPPQPQMLLNGLPAGEQPAIEEGSEEAQNPCATDESAGENPCADGGSSEQPDAETDADHSAH